MEQWAVFKDRETGQELAAYTIRGTFAGEARETAALLAAENGIDPEQVAVTIENRPIKKKPARGAKWQMFCGNALIDGIIINDFDDDSEAASYAANYEATCYRIDPDGSRTVIYTPGGDE